MDKDLFKTTRTFSFPDLMNQEPLDQDIQIVPIEPNEPIVEQTTADLFQTTTVSCYFQKKIYNTFAFLDNSNDYNN